MLHAAYPVVQPALEAEEWRLICSLREVPPSPLRDDLMQAIGALVDFAREPGCPEMQADGVPCTDAQQACDRCRKVVGVFELIRQRVRL
jgi:hypothetical protein